MIKTQHPKYIRYKVLRSYDGCDSGESPLFEGTRDECLQFMRNMPNSRWNRLNSGKSTIDLLNTSTSRFESFVL